MSQLMPQSPLMQPVAYQGQTYYPAQYFHQQYMANSQRTGKHRRYDSFMRLLRNIEAYALYVQRGDIVEVQWNRDKPQECGYLKPLFQAAGYHPLTLLNATAQIEISHHLDDELSKQMAVASSTLVARQLTAQSAIDQYPEMQAIIDQAKAVIALATKTAEARAIAENAQRDAAQANANAERAIAAQHFLTIREYVFLNHLNHQLSPSMQSAYGRWLAGYCLEKGIPVRKVQVADRQYEAENGYHTGTIDATLPGWLMRRQGQGRLTIFPTGDTP